MLRKRNEDYTLCGALATAQKNTVLSGEEPELKANPASPFLPRHLQPRSSLGSKMLGGHVRSSDETTVVVMYVEMLKRFFS